ncbi:MAG TPA: NAD(P)/FAD-dependent oxidoreductase [Candidatus Methylomirabilis sp.]|nr:NAD(P)/FAD-dependent oxidoreductase [Candidatus Methylomirabilis sp.]
MSSRIDYAIVGGGPAGLAVAIFAQLAGRRAVVLEKRRGPVDKACGEGVMPPGVAWLGRMGVEVGRQGAHPFRGIRYVDGDVVAEADFVEGPGLGVRRTVLSSAMQARAAELGADLRPECEVRAFSADADRVILETTRGRIESRWLVGADGLHGQVRQRAGFQAVVGPQRRFGVRRHFRLPPWSDFVEVHWTDDAEAYVTPVGPDLVGVALLWSARGGRPGDWDALLARFSGLRARLGAAATCPETTARGAGPFSVRVEPIARGRMALVGDAGGYLDAITGEGLSLAFATAAALVVATSGDDASAYPRAWARLRRRHIAFTRVVLWVASHPACRHHVLRALSRSPEAFRALLALNTGVWGWGRALPSVGKLGLRMLTAWSPRRTDAPRPAGAKSMSSA